MLVSLAIAQGEERATITGKVVDSDGKPIEQATVLVYKAGVKKGYSVFCPTCYVDCGKRTSTDGEGNFTIGNLSPDLLFTLLVMRNGFVATYMNQIDPAKGTANTATLKNRPAIDNGPQLVRGRVVDAQGEPVADAVIEQQGVTYNAEGGLRTSFGPTGWIDQMAISGKNGEFDLAFGKPATQMIVQIVPRGMAPKLFTLPTGGDRKTLTVTAGATIRGRLVQDGKPVTNAEVGLASHSRRSGTTYAEVRIGTQADGTFAITNIPAGRIWNVYTKMASLAGRGIGSSVVQCETKDDGEEVNLGDIEVKPGHTLRGQVVLADGKPIAPNMRVLISAEQAWDSQSAVLNADGKFEFRGLPTGVFSLSPAVRGYRLPDQVLEVLVNRPTKDVVIRIVPDKQ